MEVKIQEILQFNTCMKIVFRHPKKRKEYILGKEIEVNELNIIVIYYN